MKRILYEAIFVISHRILRENTYQNEVHAIFAIGLTLTATKCNTFLIE